MRIIEIAALSNGAHRNQTGEFCTIPEGWAIVQENVELENFPFGIFEVERRNNQLYMKTNSWVSLPMPEPTEPEYQPTQLDIIEAQVTYTAMMTDTLLEA